MAAADYELHFFLAKSLAPNLGGPILMRHPSAEQWSFIWDSERHWHSLGGRGLTLKEAAERSDLHDMQVLAPKFFGCEVHAAVRRRSVRSVVQAKRKAVAENDAKREGLTP